MATITLKDVPDTLHEQLRQEAAANVQSVNQEALLRLQPSFEIESSATSKRHQRWIDEALASGTQHLQGAWKWRKSGIVCWLATNPNEGAPQAPQFLHEHLEEPALLDGSRR